MRRNGFTLLELMIVIAIVAVLAGAIVGLLDQTHDEVTHGIAKSELATIRDAVLRFKLDNGRWPFRSNPSPDGVADPANFGLAELLVATPITTPPYSHVTWNPDARRGFRGPYLTAPRAVDDNANGTPDWLGDPWFRALNQQPGHRQPDHTFELVVQVPPLATEIRCYPSGDENESAATYLKVEVR